MPNTLAHYGIQGLLTRSVVPNADPKIIFLGCMLPDVPWILQRVLLGLVPDLDPYSVRLYVIVQASFFLTVFLCLALALLFKAPTRVFGILAMGSILHLLLDAMQTKWGNGVHLFAPFLWELLNFGLFWPEDLPTYVLTGLGLGYVIWSWRDAVSRDPNFSRLTLGRVGLCLGLLLLYLALPFFFFDGPYLEDNHYVRTLQSKDMRPGRPIEFDRTFYEKHERGDFVHAYGEQLKVREPLLDHPATVSIQGRFLTSDTIELLNLHEHRSWFRDGCSYVGLLLLSLMWGIALSRYHHSFYSGK